MTLNEIRRRPTLPGRFQPSTISVLRLNFCVRDGNRWIPQAIVTGKERGSCLSLPRGTPCVPSLSLPPSFSRQSAIELPPDFLLRLPLATQGFDTMCLSHPQNRTGWSLRLARPRLAFSSSDTLSQTFFQGFGSGPWFRFPSLCFRSGPFSYSLLPFPYSLSPRSSPRPISITKLHALPRFHR